MKFIDTCEIMAIAGNGGNGCMSFRRETYVPRGGPNGGNGGNGGDVILIADSTKHTLMDVRYIYHRRAERGVHGKGKDMHGRTGEHAYVVVPVGTVVKNADTGEILADMTEQDERLVVAKGGRGGRGNAAFVTPTQRAPRKSEEGHEGQTVRLALELKLIADVGIIGFPNAGKSTFISSVSAAKAKVADYPFTTLTPNLGVIKGLYGNAFVMADMPGLIEGAHEGVGLGIQLLRHIERTKLLLHLIDASDEESMIERYEKLRNELDKFSDHVSSKPEVIAATKMDSVYQENLDEFEAYLKENRPEVTLFKISSIAKQGTSELISHLDNTLLALMKEEDEEAL
ncbi:MAG: GTPase ObgE [Denitrovibrio sp.]|nr:MAG: GTPase ObgE [Denitrovibrio sp.]